MRFHFQQALRAAILLAFAIFLLRLHNTEEILKYINPKYEVLSQLGAMLFLVLFLTQLYRIWSPAKHTHCCCNDPDHQHDHGDGALSIKKLFFYGVIMLPVVTGFLLPEVSLNSSIASKKGTMLSLKNTALDGQKNEENPTVPDASAPPQPQMPLGGGEENAPIYDDNPPDPNLNANTMDKKEYDALMADLKTQQHIHMTEQGYAPYYQEINKERHIFAGKQITFTGFLYKENDFKSHQFVIGRFLITHCIADSNLIGFLSELPDSDQLKEDMWVKATGVISYQDYNGVKMPVIKVTEWKQIKEPKQPYVYPINVQLF